jgi:hypothetical protein
MAETAKVLGQSKPSATTLSNLYTVPASTQTVASSISVCNTGGSSDSFRISVSKAGAADSLLQYLYRDVSISANDTFVATIGLTLEETDVVRVYSTSGNCSFQLFGIEADASVGGGGSGAIEVREDSVSVVASATILNFTGAGVAVTSPGGGVATVTISGGGGGLSDPYDIWYYV